MSKPLPTFETVAGALTFIFFNVLKLKDSVCFQFLLNYLAA